MGRGGLVSSTIYEMPSKQDSNSSLFDIVAKQYILIPQVKSSG